MLKAVVYAKQKKALVFDGKKLLKTYRFKMDIPKQKVEKTVWKHDYGAWSVSDRDYETTVKVTEYDAGCIEKIKADTIEHYLNTQPTKQP